MIYIYINRETSQGPGTAEVRRDIRRVTEADKQFIPSQSRQKEIGMRSD